MAVAEVQKINIISHKKDKNKVVDFLYNSGLVEVSSWKGKIEKVEAPKIEEQASQLEYKISEIQFAINFLENYKGKEKLGIRERIMGPVIDIKKEKIKKIANKVNISDVIDKSQYLEEEINKAKSNIERFKEEKDLLSKWISLDIKIKAARETKYTKAIFATVDSEKYLEFIRDLEKNISQIDINKVSTEEQKNYLLIIFNKNLEKKAGKIFFKYGLEKVELPGLDKTPRELLADLGKDIKSAKKEISKLEIKARKISKKHLINIKILFDYYTWKLNKLSVQKDFIETKKTFIIPAWIRKDYIRILEKNLEKITTNFEVIEVDPEKDEPKPVIIKNSNFLRPFEAVTNIYGLPKSTEVDPTPFLSIFFIIFFGLCLTDAGYGLVLMALTYLAIKILKIPQKNQRLIRLLMYGGFVTFIIGALTGGWFGIVIEDLPESLGFVKIALEKIRLINPVEDPITMLVISFVLGFIQIWVGIAIDMWWKIKNRQILDGILDSGTWLYFLSSIAFYGLASFGILPESMKSIALYILISGVAIIILTQGRKQKNIFMKLLSGIGSLYGLVGYMSDILSYSRLLALGLATAVIAMVINLIAVMFKEMVPVVGWVLMVLILIGGHIFNIVINVLGAYIHSGRLQFVEFFPKFFKGGGNIFKPFRRESKYVNIQNN